MNYVYPRYFNNFGRSFLFPVQDPNGKKFKNVKCDFSPIDVFQK
jgi:hypothetical protein